MTVFCAFVDNTSRELTSTNNNNNNNNNNKETTTAVGDYSVACSERAEKEIAFTR